MSKFIISLKTNGLYYFVLKADNNQVIMTSEGYTTKAGCENGIESVKVNALEAIRFDKKKAANGKFYFILKAGNGQIIGLSQMYESEEGCQNGVDSVIEGVQKAVIVDQT
jgi:uncharacterized protein